MKRKGSVKKMAVVIPKVSSVTRETSTGWRAMKAVAQKAMEKGNFSAEDVKQDLQQFRSTYK